MAESVTQYLIPHRQKNKTKYSINRVFAESLVGFSVFVVCILREPNPNPTKNHLLWEEVAQTPLSTYFFLGWVGLGLGSSSVS